MSAHTISSSSILKTIHGKFPRGRPWKLSTSALTVINAYRERNRDKTAIIKSKLPYSNEPRKQWTGPIESTGKPTDRSPSEKIERTKWKTKQVKINTDVNGLFFDICRWFDGRSVDDTSAKSVYEINVSYLQWGGRVQLLILLIDFYALLLGGYVDCLSKPCRVIASCTRIASDILWINIVINIKMVFAESYINTIICLSCLIYWANGFGWHSNWKA